MQYTFRFRRRSYIASNDCSIFSSYATYYSYLKKTLYAGNVRVLGICIFARYLSGLWLVAFLGTVYILLLVKSMRVVLTALIDREVTSLPSPQIHLVPHSQTQHSCHAIWRFAGQSIAQVRSEELPAYLRLKSTLFRIPKFNIHVMQLGDSLDNR